MVEVLVVAAAAVLEAFCGGDGGRADSTDVGIVEGIVAAVVSRHSTVYNNSESSNSFGPWGLLVDSAAIICEWQGRV